MAENDPEVLRAVLEGIPEGIIVINEKDEITFANKAAEQIRHISADRFVGTSVLRCHPDKSHGRVKRALQFLRTEKGRTFTRMVTDTEKNRYYENVYSAIRDTASNYIGALVLSRDITDKRKREEEKAAYLQTLKEKVAELTEEIHGLFVSSMTSLVRALEAKDPYTEGHSIRVRNTAVRVAKHKYGVSPEATEVDLASKLHDIGKVGIREEVLNKPGPLSEQEFAHVKEHVLLGESILTPIEKLRSVARIVRHHHERFDGKGYPDGLQGVAIPEAARIIAIADSYDAMTSARPYRSAMKPEEAAQEIERKAGTQFDPDWTEVFVSLFHSGSIG